MEVELKYVYKTVYISSTESTREILSEDLWLFARSQIGQWLEAAILIVPVSQTCDIVVALAQAYVKVVIDPNIGDSL